MSTPTVKFKTATCVLCRQRKLRCDGGNPCGPCGRTRTLVICTYVPKTAGQLRSELPKGGACLSCRQRKRRCDGILPCSTCTSTSRAHECRYQDRPRTRKCKSAEQTYHRDRRSADGASTTSSRSTNPSQPYTPEHPRSLDLPLTYTEDEINLLPSLLNLHPAEAESSSGLYSAPTNTHWVPSDHSESNAGIDVPDYTLSDGIVLPCLLQSPRIPGPVDFSLDPAPLIDRMAELFELRNLFLDHCWHYGLNVTEEKRDALSRGDTSGLVVHPVLVNVCQLLGYQLAHRFHFGTLRYCQGPTDGREAEHTMQIFDALHAEDSALDLTTEMQVYNLLGVYYALNGNLVMFTQLFNKLGWLALQNYSVLGSDDSLVLDPSSEMDPPSCCPHGLAQETRSAFSAMIFVELTVCLELRAPPILDPSFLAKFRRLAAIHRRDTELNFMRARSALFVYDTQCLVAEWGKLEFGDPMAGTTLLKRYWNLIEDIHAHLSIANTPLLEMSFIHVVQVCTLKTCIIIALAALAHLHALFAPFQAESQQKHDEVIDEIASITSMFAGKDFKHLDPILGVCWTIALRPLIGDQLSPELHEGSTIFTLIGDSPTSLDIISECFQRLYLAKPCKPMIIS